MDHDKCGSWEPNHESSWSKAMQLFHLSAVSFSLLTAIKLKVFDVLAKHPDQQLSASQILSHIDDHSPPAASSSSISSSDRRAASVSGLDRLLRLLASHSLLTSSTSLGQIDGRPHTTLYGLTPCASFFLQPQPPHDHQDPAIALAPHYLLTHHDAYTQSWHHAHEAILEGVSPFLKAHGNDVFTYAHDHPSFRQLFDCALAAHSNLIMQALLKVYYGFDRLTSITDVGGGSGACLHYIVSKYPHIKAINFDLPHVIQAAPPYEGVQHMEGNMFDAIPQAEAIFMKWVLHDWSDEECIKILKNCYHALPTNGKVIIVDMVLPSNVDTHIDNQHGYGWDLLMFTVSPKGRERTLGELEHLARLAGPFKVQVICKVNELSVVEMYKN